MSALAHDPAVVLAAHALAALVLAWEIARALRRRGRRVDPNAYRRA